MDELLAYLKERDAREELERWLGRRNYSDPSHSDFALNPRTRRLGFTRGSDAEIATRKPLAVFLAVPYPPRSQIINPQEDAIWNWLDPSARLYEPDLKSKFLRGEVRSMLDGIICEERGYAVSGERVVVSYVAIERSGVVEVGLGQPACEIIQDHIAYHFTTVIGYFWQFLGFVSDFFSAFDQSRPFALLVCLRATQGAFLGGLAGGWRDPLDPDGYHPPECLEPGILLRRERVGPNVTSEMAVDIAHEFATRIDGAWGQRQPRCYVSSHLNAAQPFDLNAFRRFLY